MNPFRKKGMAFLLLSVIANLFVKLQLNNSCISSAIKNYSVSLMIHLHVSQNHCPVCLTSDFKTFNTPIPGSSNTVIYPSAQAPQ